MSGLIEHLHGDQLRIRSYADDSPVILHRRDNPGHMRSMAIVILIIGWTLSSPGVIATGELPL